jgi:hypothetical protein
MYRYRCLHCVYTASVLFNPKHDGWSQLLGRQLALFQNDALEGVPRIRDELLLYRYNYVATIGSEVARYHE